MLEKDKDIATINPYLVVPNLDDAASYYLDAFGARLAERYEDPSGKVWYAVLKLFGAPLQLMEPDRAMGLRAKDPAEEKEDSIAINLGVTNVDYMYKRAVGVGADVVGELRDSAWGKTGELRDPFGHRWIVGPRLAVKDRKATPLAPQVVVEDVAGYVRFLSNVFEAKEARRILGRAKAEEVPFTTVRIRGAALQVTAPNAALRLAAPPREGHPLGDTSMVTVVVDDVDGMFERAIENGAKAIIEPQDAYWGDRYAEFRDIAGLRVACCGPTSLEDEVVDPPMLQKELDNFLNINGQPETPAAAVGVKNVNMGG